MITQPHTNFTQIAAKIQCTMAYTEYTSTGQAGAQLVSRRVSTRAAGGSLLDVQVDNGSDLVAVVTHGGHDQNDGEDHPDYDTFDNVLQATSHHDSMYAYFYMDDNKKVKVTEIFDMTDDGSPALQTAQERELNQQLEFDNDWESTAQPDFLYADSYHGDGADEMIDLDELIADPCLYLNSNHSQSFPHYHQQQFHQHLQQITDGCHHHHHHVQIEELPADDAYLQPEADQQQALLSEAAARLLSKAPGSAYSIVEM